MSAEVDEYLAHFGVKGMKWGVRKRDPAYDGIATKDLPDSQKSSRRIRYEAKYLSEGKSIEEARKLADGRLTTEKIIGVSVGVAATAIAGYALKQELGKHFSSVTLKKGSELNYINALGDNADFDRRLYTTFKKGDGDKYRGLLAKSLQENSSIFGGSSDIYDTVLKTTQDIKAPSQRQARRMYAEFVRSNGIANAPKYNLMNYNIVYNDETSMKFMGFLKSRGYNAVLDANDQFISGYNTKKPLILFNAASSTVKKGQSVIKQKTIDGLYAKQNFNIALKAFASSFAPTLGLGSAVVLGAKAANNKTQYAAVNKYIQDHPNTTRSYAEIYNSIRLNSKGEWRATLKD